MMNKLIKLKFPFKLSFHEDSVLSHVASFSTFPFFNWNPNQGIAKVINFFSTFPMSIKVAFPRTFERTESNWSATSTIKSLSWLFAIFTRWSWDKLGHRSIVDGEESYVNTYI